MWFTPLEQVCISTSTVESMLTDLWDEGSYLSELRVCDGVQVHGALVRQVMENVESPYGLRSFLLVAEDEIDPLVQLTGHKFTLQRLTRQRTTGLIRGTIRASKRNYYPCKSFMRFKVYLERLHSVNWPHLSLILDAFEKNKGFLRTKVLRCTNNLFHSSPSCWCEQNPLVFWPRLAVPRHTRLSCPLSAPGRIHCCSQTSQGGSRTQGSIPVVQTNMLTSQHRNTISYSSVFTSQTLAHPNVRRVPLATSPRACDARKRPVRMVELVVITIQEKCGEGFLWD